MQELNEFSEEKTGNSFEAHAYDEDGPSDALLVLEQYANYLRMEMLKLAYQVSLLQLRNELEDGNL